VLRIQSPMSNHPRPMVWRRIDLKLSVSERRELVPLRRLGDIARHEEGKRKPRTTAVTSKSAVKSVTGPETDWGDATSRQCIRSTAETLCNMVATAAQPEAERRLTQVAQSLKCPLTAARHFIILGWSTQRGSLRGQVYSLCFAKTAMLPFAAHRRGQVYWREFNV
jgi:hypothetical protein